MCGFLGGAPTSMCLFFRPSVHPSIHPSVRPSICRAPFFKNHTSSNQNVWYTFVKWWYIQDFFHFSLSFEFLGCKRAKNSPKWKITITSVTWCTISQELYSIWSRFLVNLCKMMTSPGVFSFFWNFHFSGC